MTLSSVTAENEPTPQGLPGAPGASPPARSRGVARFWDKYYKPILGTLGIVVALAIWQYAGTSGLVNPLFISAPTHVWTALVQFAEKGNLLGNLGVSGHEFLVGFILAIVVGIPLGLLMGWYSKVEAFFDPLVNFANATPRVALLPLFIIWFGLGLNSKIALVFLSSVFPVLIGAITGVKEVDQQMVTAARSFGARDLAIFRTVILPGCVPSIATGLRLAVAHGLIAVVVGEYFSSNAGIGYVIQQASNTYQTATVFAGVVVIAGCGVILTYIFTRIEKHYQSWKPERVR